MSQEHGHGNRISTHAPDKHPCDLRKVDATTVPYGESISRNGKTVWIVYDDGGKLVVVAASAKEARRRYRDLCNTLKIRAPGGG